MTRIALRPTDYRITDNSNPTIAARLTDAATPVTRCAGCGGYLVEAGPGRYAHASVCVECWSPRGWRLGGCIAPERHDAGCAEVDPAVCEHGAGRVRCGRPVEVEAYRCRIDLSDCCGCCVDDA